MIQKDLQVRVSFLSFTTKVNKDGKRVYPYNIIVYQEVNLPTFWSACF
jgi:hypothetical protein